MTAPLQVYVIDSSALIHAKKAVAANRQWELFEELKKLVQAGTLCFPRHVRAEVSGQRHIDTPEAWVLNVAGLVKHCFDPDQEMVNQVMQVAGDVVDQESEGDPADPYVLAQALDIGRLGIEVTVVTEDVVDRQPIKISLATACRRLSIACIQFEEFVQLVSA